MSNENEILAWSAGDATQVAVDLPVNAITVEAWVRGDDGRGEALQALVSAWAPPDSFSGFAGYDAGRTDGLDCRAYFGAVFDGRYVYFAPQHYERTEAHGIVLRCDTQGGFDDPDSYAAYDAGHTDGLNTEGYYGAMFDGRYVYFVPRQDEEGYHSRVLRYDTKGEFKDEASWAAYDVGEAHSHQGVAFDGRFIYFSPGFTGDPRKEDTYSARVIRCDTEGDFKDPATWKVYDAANTSGLETYCYDGAGFDGRYVYFAPLLNGNVLRCDTQGAFDDPASWSAYAAARLGMEMCVGTVFDGRYMYFVPYASSGAVRVDTLGEFSDDASWSALDVGGIDGLDTGGFDGGFFDGRYVYFVPFVSPTEDGKSNRFHSNFLRYDTQQPFVDRQSWQAADGSRADGIETVGYNGGAFDGRFFYLAPWRDGTGEGGMHGRILRCDTLGTHGSFSLRYCDCGQNGGLCAAVAGPSFLVNTQKGVLNATAYKVLEPGWHHLVGVYDGQMIRLYIDGEVAAEQSGSGALVQSDVPVEIGRIQDGAGQFNGEIGAVEIRRVARDAEWVAARYLALRS